MLRNNRMKILHITGYTVERGGTAKIVYENAEYEQKLGHEVSIMSVDFANEQPYPVPAGVELFLLKDHWLGKFVSNYSPDFKKVFRRKDFDVIQIHGIWYWGAVAPFLYHPSSKKVITIHGMLSKWTLAQGSFKKKLFGGLFQNQGLRKAAAIIVNTEIEKQELLDYLPVDPAKIKIVANAISIPKPAENDKISEAQLKFGIQAAAKKVLFLSRVHKKKGLDVLIEAFGLICQKYKDLNLQLIVAGPDEGFLLEAQEMTTKLGIAEKVIFTGSVAGEVKNALYQMADVFALPSHSEGFPMAVMEAMAACTPVVVSDQTRIDEYLLKFNAGIVVPVAAKETAEGIERVLFDEILSKELTKNASDMLVKHFTPEVVCQRMLDIYLSLPNS